MGAEQDEAAFSTSDSHAEADLDRTFREGKQTDTSRLWSKEKESGESGYLWQTLSLSGHTTCNRVSARGL